MKSLRQFEETFDPIEKIEILIHAFGLEGIKECFDIDLTEEYVECLDIYTAYDFLELYEEYIVKRWKKMLKNV